MTNYNHLHNILRLLMFHQIFFSSQVKRWAIITCEHGIYELSNKLPNDLELRFLDLRKLRNIRKILKPHRIIAQRPAHLPQQNENSANTSKRPLKSAPRRPCPTIRWNAHHKSLQKVISNEEFGKGLKSLIFCIL